MIGLYKTTVVLGERQSVRWLLFLYSLFILYGSFIPFHFSTDHEFVRMQVSRFLLVPYQNGIRNFSILDVFSNVLLFIPFGIFLVGGELAVYLDRPLWFGASVAGAMGFIFGLTIEFGQIFSPGRTASSLDAICNALGAGMGGAVGHIFCRAIRGKWGVLITKLMKERPSALLLAIIATIPLAQAFYPFQITLDVSTVWDNLKHVQWIPFSHGTHRFWADLLVEKTLVFALIAELARRSLSDRAAPSSSALEACTITMLFALVVEGAKLLFVGRIPNIENLLFEFAGAVIGVLALPRLSAVTTRRNRSVESLIGVMLLLIIYSEMTPFEWIQSRQQIAKRFLNIEWLPLAAYYGADAQSAIFDLGKKFLLISPLGFLLAVRDFQRTGTVRRWFVPMCGLGLGLLLEGSQLFQKSRMASATDVLVFTVAAGTGAVLFVKYQEVLRASGGTHRQFQ